MANQNDLDLSTIPSEEIDKLAQKIENFYKQDSLQKTSLAYNWERNHMFLDGQQWLIYEGNRESGGQWVKLKVSPENEYIPRPVTNYIFDGYQTLKSYLLKNKPRSTVDPNSQTSKDKTAAKIAELILECNWERLHDQENYEYAVSSLVTYGTVIKKDYWDTSYLSLAKVPRTEQRPSVDPNTGMPTGDMEEVPVIDPMTGAQMYDELPLGDVQTAVVEPYCFSLDPIANTLHAARWAMEYSIRPITWISENFDKQESGFTGRVADVKPEKNLSNSLRRFYQLKTSSGVRGSVGGNSSSSSSGGSDEMIEEAAIVKEYYERPTKQYPNGRLIIVASGIPLYAGESPYKGPDQGDWHPYSECRWELVPGRFWGKGPLDDACEIQKQINSIDSIIQLTRKTMAIPQKLIPKIGGNKVGNNWNGRPGHKEYYTPGPNGEKPETIAPMGVHETVFQERAQKVEDIKNVMAAPDILKGDRPPGVTAYSSLSLLYEVGAGKLFPVMDRFKRFVESSQKKQLRLVANKYREPRPEFIRMLVSKNRDLTPDQVKDFIGTDLLDNCNVVIEAQSNIPKLKAAEHAKLQELAQTGVLNLENPKNKAEYLERFGIIGFDGEYSKDSKRASYENDKLDSLTTDPHNIPILLSTDNHDIHIGVHSERTKEPSFELQPFEIQQAYFAHIQKHQDAKDQAEQMQMMQAASMGQPPAPMANPMQQEENVRKGQPVPRKVQEAMNPDLIHTGAVNR